MSAGRRVGFLLLLLALGSSAAGSDPWLSWPFPLAETQQVITRWLTGSGYDVERVPAVEGRVRLLARRRTDRWEVELKPCSPLATCVQPSTGGDPAAAREREGALRALLERYARETAPSRPLRDDELPAPVRAQRAGVVCIESRAGGAAVQLSGFALDGAGRILTTAHDLETGSELVVFWQDGRRTPGRVVAVDREGDLALLRAAGGAGARVRLERVRDALDEGEPVFSLGCPSGLEIRAYAGTGRRPARRSGAALLWEVDLETLPGASGSPVFDAAGNLVGVLKGRLRGTETTGFLIPMETVLRFLGPAPARRDSK